jgi:hypothetical protein
MITHLNTGDNAFYDLFRQDAVKRRSLFNIIDHASGFWNKAQKSDHKILNRSQQNRKKVDGEWLAASNAYETNTYLEKWHRSASLVRTRFHCFHNTIRSLLRYHSSVSIINF